MAPADASRRSPIFLVGCPRSGTTLLRLMLDRHPDLAIPPESHFIPPLWSVRRRYVTDARVDVERLTRDIMGTMRFREWGLEEDAVWRRVRALRDPGFADVIDTVFMAYADRHGKGRWGDKTPGYSLDMPLLARLFPGARFVHIVRDGRDVVLSLSETLFSGDLIQSAQAWAHRVRKGREDGRRLGDRYVEVRYEELVDDPERVVRSVCDFVGLDYRPDMLRYYESGAESVPHREQRVHRNLARPLTKGLRDWRRDMTPDDLALVEAVLGKALLEFGYEPGFSDVPTAARVRARTGLLARNVSHRVWETWRRAAAIARRDALPPARRW